MSATTPMRLLYLGSTDFPQPKARAIQIVHTCHAMARAGADVTLVVGRRGPGSMGAELSRYGLRPHPRLHIRPVPIVRIPNTAPPRLLRWFTRVWQASYLIGVAAILPSVLRNGCPDVVYARDPRTARLAARPSRTVGAKLGFEIHGLPSFEVSEGAGRATLPPRESARLRKLEQNVFAAASHLVTITECARQILIDEYSISPAKVRTVADGTQATGHILSSHLNGSSTIEPRAPTVYYVGQLYPWKGADFFVDLAPLVPSARFVVIGGLPSRNAADPDLVSLRSRAAAAGVADRVDLRGYVPYASVAEELSRASIAVLPLPDEPVARLFTSPLKLFDYMSAGAPIVASDLPSVREILRHEENALLARAGDHEAFSAAIRRLIDDAPLAQRLAAQSMADVQAFTWDERARRILDFLSTDPARDG